MGYAVQENFVIQTKQRPSLLVVLGNGPSYQQANDIHVRQARVFSTPDAMAVTKSWQTTVAGAANYAIDVSRAQQQKFFAPDDTFFKQWKGIKLVTDANADVFNGQDTYGWPPDPTPIYWSPEGRGTENLLQSYIPYSPSTDVTYLQKNAKFFGTYDEYTKQQQPISNAITYPYVYRNDVIGFAKQAKVFDTYQEQFRTSQPITANALNVFPTYVASTDIIFRRPQQKAFSDYQDFPKQQPITGNALKFFPIYNPTTDVTRFKPQARFFDDTQTFTDRTLPPYLNTLGRGGGLPPSNFVPMPNFVGMNWYAASLLIAEDGFEQVFPPIITKRTAAFVDYEVVAQVPAAGTFVPPGSNLQLTVTFGHLLAPTFDLTV